MQGTFRSRRSIGCGSLERVEAPKRAPSRGVAKVSGRRGCGTPKTLFQILGQACAQDPARRMQRPSVTNERGRPSPDQVSRPFALFAFIACARTLLFYLPGSLHYYGHD